MPSHSQTDTTPKSIVTPAFAERDECSRLGIAIAPWWINNQQALRSWVMLQRDPAAIRRGDIAQEAADDCTNVQLRDHHVTVYAVKHTDPAQWEWLTREAYCLRALQILSQRIVETGRGLRLAFTDGLWKGFVELRNDQIGPQAVGKTLEIVCTDILSQLDPLWRREA